MENSKQNPNSFHLAGIVPVAGAPDTLQLEWPSSLIPIAPAYTALEAAVAECAHMGCETIWIVSNDDVAPLLKHRLGDYVRDVDSLERGAFINFSSTAYKEIPIYYVPVHPTHRDKIDCYAWSILHGANVAYWMCRRLSRWLIPDQYYVSFPHGIYDLQSLKPARSLLRDKTPLYFSYDGETVGDDRPLPFTFDASEWRRARDIIKSNSRTYYPPEPGEAMPTRKLPVDERLLSRRYNLGDVFGGGPIHEGKNFPLEWFYDLTTWDGYCTLLTSAHRGNIQRPSQLVFPRGTLNKLGDTA